MMTRPLVQSTAMIVLVLFMMGAGHRALAQGCPNPAQPRILWVGDSWSYYMWHNRNLSFILDAAGMADVQEFNDDPVDDATAVRPGVCDGSTTPAHPFCNIDPNQTSIGGMTAAGAVNPNTYAPGIGILERITNVLTARPSIDTVFISLGGNDFLTQWTTSLGGSAQASLFATIASNIETVANQALAVRPGIEVVIFGYDYLNFVETVFGGGGYSANTACQLAFALLGNPTPEQFNNGLSAMELVKKNQFAGNPRVRYLNNLGLLQYAHGYSGILGSFAPQFVPAPGQSPGFTPFQGGAIQFPSPPNFMDDLGGGKRDCIHLNSAGYATLLTNAMTSYIVPRYLMPPPTESFRPTEFGTDGFVFTDAGGTPSGSNISGIRVGENAPSTYARGIISFFTESIPDDAQITAASIYLFRSGAVGSNPFRTAGFGTPTVDMKTGFWGAQPAVQVDDFNDAPTVSNAGCIIGTAPSDPSVLRIDVKSTALGAVNKSGYTQFRIAFPNYLNNLFTQVEDAVSFHGSGADLALRPTFNVTYVVPTPTATQTATASPSPTPSGCGRACGDFDHSGCTDIADFLLLLDNWQTEFEGELIAIQDFLNLLDNWQSGEAC